MGPDFDLMAWRRFACLKSEIRLDITLKCGQSFRWKTHNEKSDEFIGVIRKKLWILKQDETHIFYKAFPESESKDEDILKDYLQLDVRELVSKSF